MAIKEEPDFRNEKYNWLKSKRQLDLLRLDDELMELPVLVQEASECTALAIEHRELAEEDFKRTKAQIGEQLRLTPFKDKQRSESMIESQLPLYSEYDEKLAALSSARIDASLWMGLQESLRAKSMHIRVAADLINSGFLTTDHILTKRRSDIRNANQKEVTSQ